MSATETARAAYLRLGRIVLEEYGEAACLAGYDTTDPALVGRLALGYGDINPDGSMN